jgi:hypothetical protein
MPDSSRNLFQDAFHVFHDFVIPEPQHGLSTFVQPRITQTVVFRFFRMLATVNLDYESERGTSKIDNIWTDRFLPFEFQPKETMSAQAVPSPHLGIGHDLAQRFGAHKCAPASWVHALTFADPLPRPLSRLRERGGAIQLVWRLIQGEGASP